MRINNSIDRKIADEVLIHTDSDCMNGFVTLSNKNNRGNIGIIAVDKLYRGNGIEKKLVFSAKKYFLDLGYEMIQVVTQKDNNPACKLYESCGYLVEKSEYFYHIWVD